MLSGEENIDAYLLLLLTWLSAIVLIAFGTFVMTQDLILDHLSKLGALNTAA